MHGNRRTNALRALIALLSVAVLTADLVLPFGVVTGAGYVLIVLFSLWLPRRRSTVLVALLATALALCGLFFSGERSWSVVANRCLDVFAIWLASVLVLVEGRARRLAEANERLALDVQKRAGREQYARKLLTSAPDAIVVVDQRGRIIVTNEQVCQVFGYGRGELRGQCVSTLIPERYRARHAEHMQRYAREPRLRMMGERLELYGRRKDGSEFPVEVGLSPVHTEEGLQISAAIRDISARKQVEDELRQREQQIRLLLESTAEAIYGVDVEGNCTFCNPACVRMLGYRDADELVGRNMHGLMHHSLRDGTPYPVHACRIDQSFRTGKGVHCDEEVFWRADGSCFPAEYWSYPVRRGDELVGSVVTFWDISEHRRAQEELRESREHLNLALDAGQIGTWVWRISEDEVQFDERLHAMLGTDPATFEGSFEGALGLVHPEDDERVRESLERALGGESFDVDFRTVAPDGSMRYLTVRGEVVRDEHDRPVRMVGMCIDVTDRKQAEEALNEKEEQLRQSQKLEAVGALAGGVAHEFNNLLQAIQGYTRFALDGLSPEEHRYADLQQVLKASQRAAALTGQLLGFGRRQPLRREALDMNQVVSDLETMIRPIIGEDIGLEIRREDGPNQVVGDSGVLLQMLLNLCVNARDAMRDGGKLFLRVERVALGERYCNAHAGIDPGRYVRLTVADTGCGMSNEVRQRIFEPFFTTKEVGQGSGLGLSMVYGIVQELGGSICVYSEPGHGTTFKIYLPRVDGETAADEESLLTDLRGGTETVLVAEDDSMVRDLVVRVLERAGYRVLTAVNGEEAVSAFETHAGDVDLALLDVIMPKKSGRAAYERIKALRPETKVVFCTGYDPETGQTRFAADEPVHLVQKPIDPDSLLRTIREVLDEAEERCVKRTEAHAHAAGNG
jgi:two-component system cell cycle sensor histidine kinase/response regulator CckA